MIARLLVLFALALTAMPAGASAQQLADDFSRREALQHYRTGQELLAGEQFDKAAEAFQRAISRDPLLALAHYGLGQSHMALRRFTSAVIAFRGCREAYRQLFALQESNKTAVDQIRKQELVELRDSLGQIQAGRVRVNPNTRDRIEARIRDLEREQFRSVPGGEFRPPAEVSLALGSAHFRNGDATDAEREWKAAIEVNPRLGEAHNNLAALYALTGRKRDAESAVRAAEQSGFRVNPQLKEDIRRMST
jgi:Flp pilus assembly protein TadD